MLRLGLVSFVLALSLSPVLSQPSEYKTWTPAQLRDYGTDHLKRGRSYDAAINALRAAAEREPENLDDQLALGHAYTARFASVAFARYKVERREQERREYDRRALAWERTHAVP